MAAYNRDISQVVAWTMPQLRLLARYRDMRERNERRWQLALASGMLSQEAAETLWAQLEESDAEGGPYGGVVPGGTTSSSGAAGHLSHAVDSHGNVRAPSAPLLSDIALGKAVAPQLIPITIIDKKNESKEEDA